MRDKRPLNERQNERARLRRKENPEYIRSLDKAKHNRRKEKIREYDRKRAKLPHVKKKANEWSKKKRQTDATCSNWRLRSRDHSLLRAWLCEARHRQPADTW